VAGQVTLVMFSGAKSEWDKAAGSVRTWKVRARPRTQDGDAFSPAKRGERRLAGH
jgi:hypothetical protein